MKTSAFKIAGLAIAVAALPFTTLHAHEGHDHGAAHEKHGSVADAWKTAQQSLKGIEAGAAAKQQQPIHDEQEKLAAALKDIQEHHGAQGADKTRLDGALKNAITASEKVHVAADANDFAKVDASLKTLQATMGLLEKQINPAAK
ncbi:MAG TPA: hypothetical protein VK993_01150 [Chthoniobacterales bacterium]|nr:hypothetical protein [Chthoniobacterales bacterium]